jgi:hypothetical protein
MSCGLSTSLQKWATDWTTRLRGPCVRADFLAICTRNILVTKWGFFISLFMSIGYRLKTFYRLAGLGGNIRSKSPGIQGAIYFHRKGYAHPNFYVGQAVDLNQRILREHSMPSEQEKKDIIHCTVMKDPNWSDPYWIVLTKEIIRGPKAQILWDVLKLLACLIFQTLSAKTLKKWLPPNSHIDHSNVNLNNKCLIEQARLENSNEYVFLNESSDPWVRSYIEARGFEHVSEEKRAEFFEKTRKIRAVKRLQSFQHFLRGVALDICTSGKI